MKITIKITDDIRIEISLDYWRVLPEFTKSDHTEFTYRCFSWLCFSFISLDRYTLKEEDNWSDEEVVRQMKNLEKEVESTKTVKPKPAIKPTPRRK